MVVSYLTGPLDLDPLQDGREPVGLGRQLADGFGLEATDEVARGERRLRGGAEHDRRAVVSRDLVESRDAWAENRKGDGLSLVEDDHRTGEIVQLAAPRWAVREQALEQLDVGR